VLAELSNLLGHVDTYNAAPRSASQQTTILTIYHHRLVPPSMSSAKSLPSVPWWKHAFACPTGFSQRTAAPSTGVETVIERSSNGEELGSFRFWCWTATNLNDSGPDGAFESHTGIMVCEKGNVACNVDNWSTSNPPCGTFLQSRR
jgi:hypothetical protein